MSDAAHTTSALPAIASLWEAKDGRILRVEGWTQPTTYPADDWWASCTVLNRQKGQRSRTDMGLGNFGTSLRPQALGAAPKPL